MAGRSRARGSVEAELDALGEFLRGGRNPAAIEARLGDALETGRSLVAARAAREVAERGLWELGTAVAACFSRFLVDAVKTDPGCNAKEACLETLASLEHIDPGPFLEGAAHVQREPSWGPPVDTAVSVRARAITALAAMGYPGFLVVAGDLLGDREVPVRLATAEAVLLHGAPDGAGLLLLASRREGEDPSVLGACLTGALRLSPEWSLGRVRAMLEDPEVEPRDAAALALGESGLDEAVEVLVSRLEDVPLSQDRPPLVRALAFHRSERALEALGELVADGSEGDGVEVLRALVPRRDDPRVTEALAGAVARSGRESLEDLLAELY